MYRTLLAVFTLPAFLSAATIISDSTSTQGVVAGQSVGAGFNLTSTWNNVQFSIELASNNSNGSSATAFLTSQLGTGTNASHELEASVVIPVPAGISTQILYSGLTLGPGNYFFSLNFADSLTGALGGGTATITTAPGVTSYGVYLLTTAPSGLATPITFGLSFAVTGDEVPEVPEPSTVILLSAGVAAIAALRRKRS